MYNNTVQEHNINYFCISEHSPPEPLEAGVFVDPGVVRLVSDSVWPTLGVLVRTVNIVMTNYALNATR